MTGNKLSSWPEEWDLLGSLPLCAFSWSCVRRIKPAALHLFLVQGNHGWGASPAITPGLSYSCKDRGCVTRARFRVSWHFQPLWAPWRREVRCRKMVRACGSWASEGVWESRKGNKKDRKWDKKMGEKNVKHSTQRKVFAYLSLFIVAGMDVCHGFVSIWYNRYWYLNSDEGLMVLSPCRWDEGTEVQPMGWPAALGHSALGCHPGCCSSGQLKGKNSHCKAQSGRHTYTCSLPQVRIDYGDNVILFCAEKSSVWNWDLSGVEWLSRANWKEQSYKLQGNSLHG